MDKYKLMNDGQVDSYKSFLQEKVKKWHDEVNPDYVILTETSATPMGWGFKEAWKVAYPNEKIPNFVRINPRILMQPLGGGKVGIRDATRYLPEGKFRKDYLDVRKIKNNSRVLIFDETQRSAEGLYLCVKNGELVQYMDNESLNSVLSALAKSGSENVWADTGNPEKMGYGIGKDSDSYNLQKPTFKDYNEKDNVYALRTGEVGYTSKLVKGEKRKKALATIHDLKAVGREAGEELRKGNDRNNLEKRVLGISSLVFILLSISSFSLTGNVIGNTVLDNKFGLISLLLGLISSLFYIKKK